MSKSKRTVEERIAELNKREQDMLEKASRLKAQKKELEKRYKEEQKKATADAAAFFVVNEIIQLDGLLL